MQNILLMCPLLVNGQSNPSIVDQLTQFQLESTKGFQTKSLLWLQAGTCGTKSPCSSTGRSLSFLQQLSSSSCLDGFVDTLQKQK